MGIDEGKGRGRKGKREGKGREGRGRTTPCRKFLATPLLLLYTHAC